MIIKEEWYSGFNMSKEQPKIDDELAKEFDDLVGEEGSKIAPEEQLKRSIWALEVLKQDGKVSPDMMIGELVAVLSERIEELTKTLAFAEETARSRSGDETDAELHEVAKKEVETAKRLLGYLQAAWFTLKPMSMDTYNSHMTLKDVEGMLKREQEAKEFLINQDEKMRRRDKK